MASIQSGQGLPDATAVNRRSTSGILSSCISFVKAIQHFAARPQYCNTQRED
jgi:hypothetical protein